MSILTVGSGQQYSTVAAAVGAARSGDTVNVQAGTYTNDFVTIRTDLTLNAVGGVVTMWASVSPPDGKAILTEGAAGITVSINGFTFAGASVPDQNGAGIRYEGGTLHIANARFTNNQDGILGGPDPNGVITVDHSEFDHNGTNGDGRTHNIYIGDIASFSLTNSFSHDANVGHEVKSRAESNTITGNVILDNQSTSSYEIDLPNGGNAVISGNTIQQGPNSQNPNIIAYGEEGGLHAGTSLSVTGNTIVNDMGRGPALWNATGTTATFANNAVFGFGANALVNGPAAQSGTTALTSRPTLVQGVPSAAVTPPPPAAPPASSPPASSTPPSSPPASNPPASSPAASGLVINVSEDAYQGDAQFVVSVDGQQVGGAYTATASHGAGATQTVALGPLSAGPHRIGVSFINDKWDGTAATDRNLYVDGASYDGVAIAGSGATLLANGTTAFTATGPQSPASASLPAPVSGLVINVSEDAYQGDAQFTVSVDGRQVGGVRTATAAHGAASTQPVALGALGAGPHQIGVAFINDKWDGTAATDRNLYVDGASYDGVAIAGSRATSLANGGVSFSASGPAAASGLVINVAEDAYQGDAQFVIAVDGRQVGGTYTATASHAAGQSQAISVGTLGAGAHTVGVSFINDKWDGTAATDRNLYVTGATLDGQSVAGSTATLLANGTASFGVTAGSAATSPPPTSRMLINVSEDAYQGDAQFTVAVDGTQVGGVYTATAAHAAGQSQAISLAGIAEGFTPHDIAVTFLNDKWDGLASLDRNLYVDSIQFDGQAAPGGSAALLWSGTQHFTASAPANWAG